MGNNDLFDKLAAVPGVTVEDYDAAPVFRAVRASADGREITGFLAIWGDPKTVDAYGTWFDKRNPPDLGLLTRDGHTVPFRLLYEHGFDPEVGKDIIGMVTDVWTDGRGIRFRAELDTTSPHYARVIAEIRAGKLATSSASADHLAEFDDQNRFKSWLLSELSLTAAPAEERMPAVTVIRSDVGRYLDYVTEQPSEADTVPSIEQAATGEARPHSADAGDGRSVKSAHTKGQLTMTTPTRAITAELLGLDASATPDQWYAALVDLLGAEAAKVYWESMMGNKPAAPAPEAEPPAEMMSEERSKKPADKPAVDPALTAMRAELDEMKRKQMTAPAPVPAMPPVRTGNGAVSVSEPRKYWGRSLDDLMFAHQVMVARGIRPTQDFYQVLAGRTERALAKDDAMVANPAVRSLLPSVRADEIVTSTNSGNGDEWIGVAYSGVLWEKARNTRIIDALVAKGMRVEEVAPGHESTIIYTEGADPTAYTITQSGDLDATSRPTVVVPVTAPGTGQVTLTPGYVGLAVAYTSVFEEDSLIVASTQFNNQMQQKAQETVEQLFINGDSALTLNVNYDDGNATTQYFLATNGARKYALVTGSSTSRSGGALDEEDYRLTLKLFPSNIRDRKQQMAFVIDPDTHNTSLSIAALKTQDVRGSMATLDAGVLSKIWGVDVFESGFLPLTAADGKVTYNAAGTLGTILGVYAPYWAMGWKRRVTIETQKDILAQSNLIVATFRIGFAARGAGCAVASYNLTIA